MFYHFILIILVIYPFISYIYLVNNLKSDIKFFYNFFITFINNISHYFYDNISFIFLFPIKKSLFINLIIRFIEINKEGDKYINRNKYISWQFIDFFYFKVLFNYFYA